MELVWLVYAISLLDSIPALLFFAVTVVVVAIITYGCLALANLDKLEYSHYTNERKAQFVLNIKEYKSLAKKFIALLVVLLVILTALPSKKTAYIMVGAYVTQQIAQNKKVEEVGAKVYTLINSQLDTYLADLEAEVAKKKKKVSE